MMCIYEVLLSECASGRQYRQLPAVFRLKYLCGLFTHEIIGLYNSILSLRRASPAIPPHDGEIKSMAPVRWRDSSKHVEEIMPSNYTSNTMFGEIC